MADLLLQARPGSSIRLKPANISSRLQPKPIQHRKETASSDNVVGVITKALGEANDLWLWCKDGMTPKQRVLVQQREERRRTLCDRMKEVVILDFALRFYRRRLTFSGPITKTMARRRTRARRIGGQRRMEEGRR